MPPLEDLVACPHCDTLHLDEALVEGQSAHCAQCGAIMHRERGSAIASVLSLAFTSFILMIAALTLPFLDLTVSGNSNNATVLSAVTAFSDTFSLPLAFAVAAFIIFIPLLRLGAVIVAVTPLVLQRRPRAASRLAFSLADRLRPWSMAEIFIVGTAVALVKVAGLATVTFGPAFWAFTILVVLTVFQDTLICRYSIWRMLDKSKT